MSSAAPHLIPTLTRFAAILSDVSDRIPAEEVEDEDPSGPQDQVEGHTSYVTMIGIALCLLCLWAGLCAV